MHPKDALGAHGEDLAAAHLIEAGLKVLDRNWRCPIGELDIVAREGNILVFCEVKTRRSTAFGDPAEAVTWRKARKLRQLAGQWLTEHDEHAREVRFDVVAVLAGPGTPATVRHLRAAL
ncbi:MAG: YraN family protein [Actinomycetota bacterium]|nr:YraN family protein [Actinomycetota bacterium]